MMKTTEIKNLKTSKTEKQVQDEITALKAKKKVQLMQTDWTQLKDVHLENEEQILGWRKAVRNLEITSLEDKSALEVLIKNRPPLVLTEEVPPFEIEDAPPEEDEEDIVFFDSTSDEEYMSDLMNTVIEDFLTIDSKEYAKKFLLEALVGEKNAALSKADSSSYSLFRLLQEELIEHELGTNPPKFLAKYMASIGLNPQVTEDLKEVEEICKEFFSTVNAVFFTFEEKIRSVYTMSNEDLERELKKLGYRYRPAD